MRRIWNNTKHLLRRAGLASEVTPWELPGRLGEARDCRSILERLSEVALRLPDQTALEDFKHRYTYRQLLRRSASVAGDILALQPKATEPVVILMPPGARFLLVGLGVMRTGRAFLHLDPTLPIERLRQSVVASGASLILVHNAKTSGLAEGLAEGRCVTSVVNIKSDGISRPEEPPARATEPDAPCFILFTSGSTGERQAFARSHAAVLNSALGASRVARISPRDCLAVCAAPAFGFALVGVFAALLSGARVRLCRMQGGPNLAWLEEATAPDVTMILTVPTVLRNITKSLQPGAGAALRHVMVGGEPLSSVALREVLQQLPAGATLEFTYGMTESGGTLCRQMVDQRWDSGGEAIPVGRPTPGCRVWIEDDEGQVVPPGEPGHIMAAWPFFARRCAEGRLEPAPAQLRTGDWGRVRPDGLLEVLGRVDMALKSRGIRVSASEIEQIILKNSSVLEVAVTASWGDSTPGLTAWVVSREASTLNAPLLRPLLNASLSAALPREAIPSRFIRVDRLPRLPNGKIDRVALSASTSAQPSAVAVAPRTAEDALLMRIWSEALSIEPKSVYDNFFELGGDSLAASGILAGIATHFGVTLTSEVFYIKPTIAEMAEHVALASKGGGSLAEGAGPSPLFLSIMPGDGDAPIILFPGGAADASNFIKLRAILMDVGVKGPIFGFSPLPWLRTRSECASVRELIQEGMPQILEVLRQFPKPGILLGLCIGGRAATEAAAQLASNSGPACPQPRLVLLDTPAGDFETLGIAKPDRIKMDEQLQGAEKSYMQLIRSWDPNQVPVRFDLVMNEDYQRRSVDPSLGWEPHAREGYRLHVIPGTHSSRFGRDRPSLVKTLRSIFEECGFLQGAGEEGAALPPEAEETVPGISLGKGSVILE